MPAFLPGVLLALLLAGCQTHEPPPEEEGGPPAITLVPDQTYRREVLRGEEPVHYRFLAEHRGPYLVMLRDAGSSAPVTLVHPRKTCLIPGNGACELIASPGENVRFFLRVEGAVFLDYSLEVSFTEGTGLFEGQAGKPVPLILGRQSHGKVGRWEASYYVFRTAEAGAYRVRLEAARSDLAWRLFDRAAFDVILQVCDEHEAARDEICTTASLSADTLYYLKVIEQSGVPATYSLAIEH